MGDHHGFESSARMTINIPFAINQYGQYTDISYNQYFKKQSVLVSLLFDSIIIFKT